MASVDSELIGILNNLSLKIDARHKGWEYVLGLTATEGGMNHIISSNKYIQFVLAYSCGIYPPIQQNVAENELTNLAFKCLVNISNHEKGAFALLDTKKDYLEYLLSCICNEKTKFVQPMCYILSNISSHPELAKRIMNVLVSSEDLLKRLMEVYCSSKIQIRSQYDFLTLVFANLSRLTSGRRLFLQDADFITRIFAFTKSSEPEVRRLGVALVLRNCCSEIDYHERLLKDLAILPVLLLPLMDSGEYEDYEMDKLPIECQCLEETKVRDLNPSVRRVLVQAFTALCYSERGWDSIQAHGVYYVIRDLHLWETDKQVKDTIENLVPYLLVEQYSRPNEGDCNVGEDPLLIQQLEADIIRDLPDYVV